MGAADEYVTMMGIGASSPGDVLCAEEVKGPMYAAAGCTVGTVGAGLFGLYKFFKGKPAAGVTGFAAGAVLLVIGRVMAKTAAAKFETCRTASQPPVAKPPMAP